MAEQARGDRVISTGEEKRLVWGINALVLKSPWKSSPSLDDLLGDQEHTVALSSFYRVGGEHRPATPTELRIAYDSAALLVVFRCGENNLSFPVANQEADWYSLGGTPGGSESTTSTSSPPFPDEVDFFVQPDMSTSFYYHFAATLDGLTFGCERLRSRNTHKDESAREVGTSVCLSKANGFEATVTRKRNEWIAFFQVPWKTLGGKPKSYFGLLPMRTRWRDGEFSSPVGIDFVETLPVDLFIETHFIAESAEQASPMSLCQLPSGLLRWQRPAVVLHPGLGTLQQIWQMQLSLGTPTDMKTLAQRLYLTQRWIDLLTLEGFNFLPATGTILKENMTPAIARYEINAALSQYEPVRACQLLDSYLGKLDKAASWGTQLGKSPDTNC